MIKSITKYDGLILAVAMVFPFFLTLVYFVLLADAPSDVQKLTYGIGKTIQFALPVVWIGIVCRERWFLRRFSSRNLGESIGFGVCVFAAMLLLYWGWLRHPGEALAMDSPARAAVIAKINGFGINDVRLFLLLGTFYSVIHSGLEEYYWRWFVFRRLQNGMSWLSAAVISSTGFMLHHVILLGTYFGYASPLCWLGSFGVAIGGFYWAWLYHRNGSIWASWISHGIIDAAIFTVGFIICYR